MTGRSSGMEENTMRHLMSSVMLIALLALPNLGAARETTAAVIPGGGGLGYTCSDPMGGKKSCTCTSAADCWWMGVKGVCGDIVVMECNPDGSPPCSCNWNKVVSPSADSGIRLNFNGSDLVSP